MTWVIFIIVLGGSLFSAAGLGMCRGAISKKQSRAETFCDLFLANANFGILGWALNYHLLGGRTWSAALIVGLMCGIGALIYYKVAKYIRENIKK